MDEKPWQKTVILRDGDGQENERRVTSYLLVIFGNEADLGKETELGERAVAGRSLENDLSVNDPLMSRKHFGIVKHDGLYHLQDLGSMNGTFLNQQPLQKETPLKSGDIITAGRTVFKFESRTELESIFHKYLYAAATTDRMTQLFNKYYFLEELKKQNSFARRYGKSFGIVMIDVDNFKRVNDSFGHIIGDEVLKFIAFKILASVRENDLASRYGGEEFAVLLPETDLMGAMAVAERIRKHVESEILEIRENKIGATISLGLAVYPQDGEEWEEVLKKADERLYIAKQSGKNRLVGPDGHL